MYRLISATPSPYARKVGIALAEKNIPFELQTEVPWDAETRTPAYNPLEKLPVLVPPDGRFGLADIAAGTVLGYLDVRFPEHPWRNVHPALVRVADRLAERPSFRATVPVPQRIADRVV